MDSPILSTANTTTASASRYPSSLFNSNKSHITTSNKHTRHINYQLPSSSSSTSNVDNNNSSNPTHHSHHHGSASGGRYNSLFDGDDQDDEITCQDLESNDHRRHDHLLHHHNNLDDINNDSLNRDFTNNNNNNKYDDHDHRRLLSSSSDRDTTTNKNRNSNNKELDQFHHHQQQQPHIPISSNIRNSSSTSHQKQNTRTPSSSSYNQHPSASLTHDSITDRMISPSPSPSHEDFIHLPHHRRSSLSNKRQLLVGHQPQTRNPIHHHSHYETNHSNNSNNNNCSVTNRQLDDLMAKLERDNKILAELDSEINLLSKGANNLTSTSDPLDNIPPSSSTSKVIGHERHPLHHQSSLPLSGSYAANENNFFSDGGRATANSLIGMTTTARYGTPGGGTNSVATNAVLMGVDRAPTIASQLPTSLSRAQSSIGQQLIQQQLDEVRQVEDMVDSIEIPGRGRCKVYMAKYSYDPFKQSPNINPDAELAFVAGDYILCFEDIDEDGFFIGELMDGRRGYVPSNWLDRLTGEDLFDFQASILFGQHGDDDSEGASYPPEFYDAIVNDTISHTNFQHLLAPEDFHRMNDYVDLNDVTEIDDECLSDYERAEAEQMRKAVAPPQRLMLERQLNKSILIAWLHPQAAKGTIVSYQIYVDGVLKSTVPSGDRTKALLEGVDSNIPHRISVRAIDHHGRHSNDAGCTIVIGKNIPFAPSCVKASHITSDSALISWLPCNSNFHHCVAVNSVEVQTVRPGIYKHLINGLSANTLYRVWVRAKPGKLLAIDEKNPKKLESLTTYVDFRTVPKSLPDPPVNIQVEAGPQQKTLLVTWLPLTLNNYGTSNGCAVTGYAVFAGHKKLADIDSPTGDHALLDLGDLESLHKKSVTVRTKSGENLSQDSMPCQIPDEYLKSNCRPKNDTQQRIVKQQGPIHIEYKHSPMRHPQHFGRSGSVQRSSSVKHAGSNIMGHPESRTRSMQNLESDDSRSSIPMIEITNKSHNESNNPNESYSEEEFENSMRLRGMRGRQGRLNKYNPELRNRSRQSQSVDSSYNNPQNRFRKLYNAKSSSIDRELRYFVALFDYDPTTMSPNPDAASEELAFREGSVIKVYGDKGPDGFYRGELDGRIGYVPCNVVSEISDPSSRSSLLEKQQLGFAQNQLRPRQHMLQNQTPNNPNMIPQQPVTASAPTQESWQQSNEQFSIKKMVALYDYDPQENSPNADTERMANLRADGQLGQYQQQRLQQVQQLQQPQQQASANSPLPSQGGSMNSYNQQPPFDQFNRQTVIPPGVQQQQQMPNRQMVQNYQTQPPMMTMSGNQQNFKNPGNRMNNNSSMPNQISNDMMDMVNQNTIINRPTTLNLASNGLSSSGQGNWVGQGGAMPNQQQTNQGLANPNSMQNQSRFVTDATTGQFNIPGVQINNQKATNVSGQQLTLQQQQQQQQLQQLQQQQQHNQQPGGGMFSNLLTSGKQIIEAATTPRNPNQPSQFPSNLSGNYVTNNMNNQPYPPSSHFSSTVGGAIGQQVVQPPQQHQQSSQYGQQQQQQQQQPMSQFNTMRGTLGDHQGYHTNLDMFGNPQNVLGGANQPGGNILNTMKNIFKL